jgi:hypothetical protein
MRRIAFVACVAASVTHTEVRSLRGLAGASALHHLSAP